VTGEDQKPLGFGMGRRTRSIRSIKGFASINVEEDGENSNQELSNKE
jgi:hypothetical protein